MKLNITTKHFSITLVLALLSFEYNKVVNLMFTFHFTFILDLK